MGGGLCPGEGALCPGEGVSVHQVSVQGALCSGVRFSLQGRGSLSREGVSVQGREPMSRDGVSVQGREFSV